MSEYKHGTPKLTPEQKAAMLADYSAGMPTKQIAAKYNVDPSYPSKVVGRRRLQMRRSDAQRSNQARAAEKRWSNWQ